MLEAISERRAIARRAVRPENRLRLFRSLNVDGSATGIGRLTRGRSLPRLDIGERLAAVPYQEPCPVGGSRYAAGSATLGPPIGVSARSDARLRVMCGYLKLATAALAFILPAPLGTGAPAEGRAALGIG